MKKAFEELVAWLARKVSQVCLESQEDEDFRVFQVNKVSKDFLEKSDFLDFRLVNPFCGFVIGVETTRHYLALFRYFSAFGRFRRSRFPMVAWWRMDDNLIIRRKTPPGLEYLYLFRCFLFIA